MPAFHANAFKRKICFTLKERSRHTPMRPRCRHSAAWSIPQFLGLGVEGRSSKRDTHRDQTTDPVIRWSAILRWRYSQSLCSMGSIAVTRGSIIREVFS
jgi:hypothetical protein